MANPLHDNERSPKGKDDKKPAPKHDAEPEKTQTEPTNEKGQTQGEERDDVSDKSPIGEGAKSDVLDRLKMLHDSHEKERTSMLGNHEAQRRDMHNRHREMIRDMDKRHLENIRKHMDDHLKLNQGGAEPGVAEGESGKVEDVGDAGGEKEKAGE